MGRGDWNMGGSGDAFKEGRRAGILHGKVDVLFNFVSEGRYVGEMDNAVVFHIGDGKGEWLLVSFMARIRTMMSSIHAFISMLSGWSLL